MSVRRIPFASILAVCCCCLVLTGWTIPLPAQEVSSDDSAGAVAAEPGPEAAKESEADFPATHTQTGIIKVVGDQPGLELYTFCLSRDGRILAGVSGAPGAIQVYSGDGQRLATWPLSIKPEAINTRADGAIYVGGSGRLQHLTAQGDLLLDKPAPQAQQLKLDTDKIRAQIIQQAKVYAETYTRYPELFKAQIARLEAMLTKLPGDAAQAAQQRELLKQQIATYQQALKHHEQKAQENAAGELTEEQIQTQIAAMIEDKARISSISASDSEVFVACPAVEGYGFEVWRTDAEFENATRIVSELRGCCGQMDVQADNKGVFVAENARHRVCRFDREGSMQCEWGGQQREGVQGFGSCCNPMNVAFGTGDDVYTAESTSGRIKRYSPNGELRGLVGSVDIVPGCKKVSIAVNQDGSRVYMLDITRNHIVVMSRKPQPDSEAAAAN